MTVIRRAFSLTEVLIAIGCIALLLAVLLPALSSVGGSGRSARCLFNLKQMALAAQQYGIECTMFPVAVRYENNGGSFRNVSWDYVTAGTQVISPGVLWRFTNNPDEVMQCPDYAGPANAGEEYSGYNYNTTYVGGEANFPNVGWNAIRPGIPPHACRRGSACAMFGDAGRKNGTNRYMRAPLRSEGLTVPWSAIYSGGQSFRHTGHTNVAFVDGHVGARSTPHEGAGSPSNKSMLLSQTMDFPRNGFLSNDDRSYDPR